jgi:hypothetical protein
MEKVQHDPISVKMLKINGDELMRILEINPSVIIGTILDILLAEVIEDPKLNNIEYLTKRSKELKKNDINEQNALAAAEAAMSIARPLAKNAHKVPLFVSIIKKDILEIT